MATATMVAQQDQPLLVEQRAILGMIVRDAPVMETLAAVIAFAEQMEPGAKAGVTIVDRTARALEMAVFPSIDRAFADSLAGVALTPPHVGTCAQALYRGEVVTSNDLANDHRFAKEWRKLCHDHGIRSCRSQPFCTAQGAPLGTFMLCFPQPGGPSRLHDTLMTTCATLTQLALERRGLRERHELMIGELQHRTQNLFAAIGALARFTFPNDGDIAACRETFIGRVHALATAHAQMVSARGNAIHTLIGDALEPYGRDQLIHMSGPPIRLAPDTASAMGMAIHELATNAVKYGALSNDAGTLDIVWDIAPRPGGEAWFSLIWNESGGPAVEPPTRRGFGVRAIERMLAQTINGTVQLDFRPEGLRCSIEAPFGDRLGTRL